MLTGRSDGYKPIPYVLLDRKRVDPKQLKWCGIDTAVVPGGCTKFIQAPEVCWNAPFKAKFASFMRTG
uniref:Uncharacterized protein n=1 Tax=Ditylenchus dipsaci TaxID=166011 RepID=A0A915D139_9BILA